MVLLFLREELDIIYLFHKKTVGKVLAETSTLQVSEDEAKKIVEVGLLLRKYTLQEQTPFIGCKVDVSARI